MAEYTIDKIEYSGNVYKLQDNVSGYVTTDNKLEIDSNLSNTTYYPIIATNSTTAATRKYDVTGFKYDVSNGTTSSSGSSKIILGNATSVNEAGNKQGIIRLYGLYNGYVDISLSTYTTAGRTLTIPNQTGTIALTSDIPDVSGKIDTAGTGLSKSGTTLNHTNSVTAQTTQAVYPIKIDAQGHISAYGSAVTIPSAYSLPLAANGTRGGVQIGYTQSGKNYPVQLSSEKMYVNVPWTDSDISTLTLTSGSTAGTALTYGGKFTLTAGSKTVSFTMPASDNTDTKVTQAYSTTNSDYPLLMTATAGTSSTSSRGATTAILNNGLYYNPSTNKLLNSGEITSNSMSALSIEAGSIETNGIALLNPDTGGGSHAGMLLPPESNTENYTYYLPSIDGTLATLEDLEDLSSVTLNGSANTSPSFYAPTTAGTSGQYLKSSGGTPTWANFPTIPSITLNGSSSTSPSFYAPTTAGTSGYYLKSSGSGAPTWAAIPADTDEKVKLTSQSTSGSYPLIFGPTSITSNSTYQGYYNTGVTVNPSTKTVTATTFVGALTGTASGNLTSSSTLDAGKLSGTIPSGCYTNTTYTFANGTNGFTVTPSGGSAQTVTVTPSITNNVTGSGTSGQLAQWNGANTLTSGPKVTISTSTPSGGSNGDIWFVYS